MKSEMKNNNVNNAKINRSNPNSEINNRKQDNDSSKIPPRAKVGIVVGTIKDIINLYQVGEKVSAKVIITKFELKKQKNNPNKEFVTLDIQDSTGILCNNKIWSENLALMPKEMMERLLKVGKNGPVCVAIGGVIETYLGTPYLNVAGLIFRDEDNIDDYVPKTREDIDGMYEYIVDKASSISSPFRDILLENLKDNEEIFKSAPAAKRYHDNFKGGLLEHTFKLLKVYNSVASLYETINKEIMIFLIIKHDFEKINGYTLMPSIEWTDQEEYVGHQIMGAISTYNDLKKYDVEDSVIMPILNALISHHGKAEWGAAKAPVTPEAKLLAHLDYMISDIAKANQSILDKGKEYGKIDRELFYPDYNLNKL
ncbi:hypothetical protein ACV3UL_15945 [Clostridium perfringens]